MGVKATNGHRDTPLIRNFQPRCARFSYGRLVMYVRHERERTAWNPIAHSIFSKIVHRAVRLSLNGKNDKHRQAECLMYTEGWKGWPGKF